MLYSGTASTKNAEQWQRTSAKMLRLENNIPHYIVFYKFLKQKEVFWYMKTQCTILLLFLKLNTHTHTHTQTFIHIYTWNSGNGI